MEQDALMKTTKGHAGRTSLSRCAAALVFALVSAACGSDVPATSETSKADSSVVPADPTDEGSAGVPPDASDDGAIEVATDKKAKHQIIRISDVPTQLMVGDAWVMEIDSRTAVEVSVDGGCDLVGAQTILGESAGRCDIDVEAEETDEWLGAQTSSIVEIIAGDQTTEGAAITLSESLPEEVEVDSDPIKLTPAHPSSGSFTFESNGCTTTRTGEVSFPAKGECVIVIRVAGDAEWSSRSLVKSIEVTPLPNVLKFDGLDDPDEPVFVGTTNGIRVRSQAAGTASLEVEGACSLDESTLTFSSVGDCTISAHHPGDDKYDVNRLSTTLSVVEPTKKTSEFEWVWTGPNHSDGADQAVMYVGEKATLSISLDGRQSDISLELQRDSEGCSATVYPSRIEISAKSVGDCYVKASVTGDEVWESGSSSFFIDVQKAVQPVKVSLDGSEWVDISDNIEHKVNNCCINVSIDLSGVQTHAKLKPDGSCWLDSENEFVVFWPGGAEGCSVHILIEEDQKWAAESGKVAIIAEPLVVHWRYTEVPASNACVSPNDRLRIVAVFTHEIGNLWIMGKDGSDEYRGDKLRFNSTQSGATTTFDITISEGLNSDETIDFSIANYAPGTTLYDAQAPDHFSWTACDKAPPPTTATPVTSDPPFPSSTGGNSSPPTTAATDPPPTSSP